MTRDEKFLLELFKESKGSSREKTGIDPDHISKKLGLSERQTKTILRWLFQANIIKTLEGNQIYLTSHGESVARSLIE